MTRVTLVLGTLATRLVAIAIVVPVQDMVGSIRRLVLVRSASAFETKPRLGLVAHPLLIGYLAPSILASLYQPWCCRPAESLVT